MREYSFATKAWNPLAKLSQPKNFFGSAAIDGAIYAVGGNIEVLRSGASGWETVCEEGTLPTSHFSVAAIGRTIYILGKELLAFDVNSKKLRALQAYPGMKEGDHFELFVAVGDDLHVIGGLDGETFEQRKSHWRLRNGQWQRMPDAPEGIFTKFAAVEVVGRSVFFLSAGVSLRWDEGVGDWKKLAPMPQMVAMPGSFVRDGWIHVLGGLAVEGTARPMAYSMGEDRWITGGSTLLPVKGSDR